MTLSFFFICTEWFCVLNWRHELNAEISTELFQFQRNTTEQEILKNDTPASFVLCVHCSNSHAKKKSNLDQARENLRGSKTIDAGTSSYICLWVSR